MADFCGLTRVKTWRWSRLFACAVAVFCTLSPTVSVAVDNLNDYVCTNEYTACNPGFTVTNSEPWCVACPDGKYKGRRDTKTDSNGTNFSCVSCPSSTSICPEVTINNNYYGRPILLCKAGYYRATDSSEGGFKCEECPDGRDKNTDNEDDVITALTENLKSDGTLYINSTRVFLPNNLLGPNQCKKCKSGSYYHKGYYTDGGTAAYTDTNSVPQCAACPANTVDNGCKADGAILCKENYYRWFDGTNPGAVICDHCQGYTGKDADSDVYDKTTGADNLCNRCESSAYYWSRKSSDEHMCYACPTHAVKNQDNNTGCTNSAMVFGGTNDILCEKGYYRTTDTSTGVVDCVACPIGYTKDADTDPTVAANNESSGADSCNKCAAGYFRLDGGSCVKCPNENDPGVYYCRYNESDAETNLLLCKPGYYSDMNNMVPTCKKCPGNTNRTGNESQDNDNFPKGIASCNICNDGYFVPERNATPGSNTCYKCPNNGNCVSSSAGNFGQVNCDANYYLNFDNSDNKDTKYKCSQCPSFTGKIKDTNKYVGDFSPGQEQCNICVDGYYGSPVIGGTFNRAGCSSCPAYAKLNVLGICIHGRTTTPNNNGLFDAGNKSVEDNKNTVKQCFIPVAKGPIVEGGYQPISGGPEYRYTVNPEFTDTTGIFEHADMNNNWWWACEKENETENISESGACEPVLGQHCVYVDISIATNTDDLSSGTACMQAILWRSKDKKTNYYQIRDTTATDILRQWGKDNPWFCTDDKNEADLFRNCLIGENAPEECKHNNSYCMMGDQKTKVKICQYNEAHECIDE